MVQRQRAEMYECETLTSDRSCSIAFNSASSVNAVSKEGLGTDVRRFFWPFGRRGEVLSGDFEGLASNGSLTKLRGTSTLFEASV